MFRLFVAFLITILFAGCNSAVDECPAKWNLNLRELSATVQPMDGKCVLRIQNPKEQEGIIMRQQYLEGDFEIQLRIEQFTRDSTIVPQFRFEVYDPTETIPLYSGVAISPGVFYTYVEFSEFQPPDNRLVNYETGTIAISRVSDSLVVAADIGGETLSFGKAVSEDALAIRMVLGVVEEGNGTVEVALDDFIVYSGTLLSDNFSCRSW